MIMVGSHIGFHRVQYSLYSCFPLGSLVPWLVVQWWPMHRVNVSASLVTTAPLQCIMHVEFVTLC